DDGRHASVLFVATVDYDPIVLATQRLAACRIGEVHGVVDAMERRLHHGEPGSAGGIETTGLDQEPSPFPRTLAIVSIQGQQIAYAWLCHRILRQRLGLFRKPGGKRLADRIDPLATEAGDTA